MILPSKLFSYNQSVLPKMVVLIKEIQKQDRGVLELFQQVQDKFDGVDEFVETLDGLYALGKIELDTNRLYFCLINSSNVT